MTGGVRAGREGSGELHRTFPQNKRAVKLRVEGRVLLLEPHGRGHRAAWVSGDPLPMAGSVTLRVQPPGLGWRHRVTEGQQGRGVDGRVSE